MDAIIQSMTSRESELTAIARLVIYAQTAARDIRANEVDEQLSKTLEAIIRELEGMAEGNELRAVVGAPASVLTRQ